MRLSRKSPVKQLIELFVNNESYGLAVEPQSTLLEVLRNDLGLTGTKEACGTGECGSCTVLIDGRPVLSCLTLALDCTGQNILTIEGLAQGEEMSPVQQAFQDCGAIQCGFCSPGMVLSAKALLEKNPHPTEEEIKKAPDTTRLLRRLIRPPGRRQERSVETETTMGDRLDYIGQRVPRKDGPVKAIVTAKDTAGIKHGFVETPRYPPDQYPMATDKVRFVGEEIAAVAATDPYVAQEVRVINNCGGYRGSGVVAIFLAWGFIMLPYRLPNLRYEGYAVYTNNPIRALQRGHGAPQVRFAIESQLDMIARELGIDPVEIQLRNAREPGEQLPNGDNVHNCGLKECLEKAAEHTSFQKRYGRKVSTASPHTPLRRGIGIGVSAYFGGSLIYPNTSSVVVKMNDDGTVTMLTGALERELRI